MGSERIYNLDDDGNFTKDIQFVFNVHACLKGDLTL